MIKGIKIRLYPTKAQEELMWKHVHASRFIYNYMLALQNENHSNGKSYISRFDMGKLLTSLKRESDFEWLTEVSSKTLQAVCNDLNESFTRFFNNKSKHPKFKKRKTAKRAYISTYY